MHWWKFPFAKRQWTRIFFFTVEWIKRFLSPSEFPNWKNPFLFSFSERQTKSSAFKARVHRENVWEYRLKKWKKFLCQISNKFKTSPINFTSYVNLHINNYGVNNLKAWLIFGSKRHHSLLFIALVFQRCFNILKTFLWNTKKNRI